MNLKVRYSELKNFSNVIDKDSAIIDAEINNVLKNLDKLMNVWQGYDADQFHEHATAYFTTMRNIPKAMRNMTKSISTAVDGYHSAEDSFNQMLRGESERYPKKKSNSGHAVAFSPRSIASSGSVASSTTTLGTTNVNVRRIDAYGKK